METPIYGAIEWTSLLLRLRQYASQRSGLYLKKAWGIYVVDRFTGIEIWENPHLTFFTFPARIMQDGHISTGDGIFGFDNIGKMQTRPYYLAEDTSRTQSVLTLRPRRDFIQAVKERSKRLTSGQRPPTFSKQGQEYEVTLQHGTYSQWL